MSPQDFELHPPGKLVLMFPLLIGVVFPLLAFVALLLAPHPPADAHGYLGAAPLLTMPLIGAGMAWNLLRRRVRLSDAGLRIRSLPWPRTIPASDFDLERAEIVDLQSRPELMPAWKIAGTRLPGYRAGRFRLRDKRYASVLLTQLRRVLVLPKRDGSVVMLSVERPDALLKSLRQLGDIRRG